MHLHQSIETYNRIVLPYMTHVQYIHVSLIFIKIVIFLYKKYHIRHQRLAYINYPDCIICYDKISNINTTTTLCNHTYHLKCLLKWCKEHNTCPICRDNLHDNIIALQ